MKYSGACTDNSESTPELSRQYLVTDKIFEPNMAQLIRKWDMSSEQCVKESRNYNKLTRSPQQKPVEHISWLEDAMEIDLIPELPPSGGYEKSDSHGRVL